VLMSQQATPRYDCPVLDPTRAEALASELLASVGSREVHVRAVAGRAGHLRKIVSSDELETFVMAAFLHDIGYAPQLVQHGFHPLDGALYLRSIRVPERVVDLVAHHSGALFEAEERGLSDRLDAFLFRDGQVMDALVWADMTTGPQGQRMTFEERVSDILHRYPAGDPVHRAMLRARSYLSGCVERTESRLRGSTA
jgi:hypothetical protein